MNISLVKRQQPSALFAAVSPLIALTLTVAIGALLFAAQGQAPGTALYTYFIEPLTETWSLHELAIKAAPLILIAVGLALCFQSRNWNIGAEGQFIMGAILGSALPVLAPDFTPWLLLPMMVMLGALGGAAYGAIPALLKTRFNTNEILTSLMLVYVAQLFLDWLVRGPWRNPEGYNFPETRIFSDAATLPMVWADSGRAHWGIVFALIAAVVLYLVQRKTLTGYRFRVVGLSPRAGRFAGFSESRTVFMAFCLSGALAGIAGLAEVSGASQQLRPVISPGYGFTAIIVAFLGRLNPLGIVAAGIVLALTYLGGEAAQMSLGLSDKVVRVFQGMLLFFVLATDTLIHYQIRIARAGARRGNR